MILQNIKFWAGFVPATADELMVSYLTTRDIISLLLTTCIESDCLALVHRNQFNILLFLDVSYILQFKAFAQVVGDFLYVFVFPSFYSYGTVYSVSVV